MKEKFILVLTGEENQDELRKILEKVKYIELRLDIFLKLNNKEDFIEWVKKIRKFGENEIIGTCRWYKEAGFNSHYISDRERIEIYRTISDYVDIIDIELRSRILGNIIEIAKSRNKKVIVSYHNFKKTPNLEYLKRLVKKGRKVGDMVKIATKVNTRQNLLDLIFLTHLYSKKTKIITVPMNTSIFERLIPLFFGSTFTYISYKYKTAPGQPTLNEIEALSTIFI